MKSAKKERERKREGREGVVEQETDEEQQRSTHIDRYMNVIIQK